MTRCYRDAVKICIGDHLCLDSRGVERIPRLWERIDVQREEYRTFESRHHNEMVH